MTCAGALLPGAPPRWAAAVEYHASLCDGEYGYVAPKTQPFGIVLIACGPAQIYREWAFNLACGIRLAEDRFAGGKRIPITLLVDAEHGTSGLWDLHFQKAFPDVVTVQDCHLRTARRGKREWHKLKAHAWRYSPYELTWQLDVDSVWLDRHADPWALYEAEKQHDWLVYAYETKPATLMLKNEAEDVGWWMRIKDLVKLYALPLTHTITCCNSSWMHYRFTPQIQALLETHEAAYESMPETGWTLVDAANSDRTKCVEPSLDYWRDGIPDEAPLTIASAIHNIVPGIEPFRPAFWGYRPGESWMESSAAQSGCRIVTIPGFQIDRNLLDLMNYITRRQQCELRNDHWRPFYSKGDRHLTNIAEAWRN